MDSPMSDRTHRTMRSCTQHGVVLFLGAGASRAFKIPDAKEMASSFIHKYSGSPYEIDLRLLDKWIKERNGRLDIESLLTALNQAAGFRDSFENYWFQRLPAYEPVASECMMIAKTSDTLLGDLIRHVRESCILDRVEIEAATDIYMRWFRGLSQLFPAVRLFTTNYDSLIETACHSLDESIHFRMSWEPSRGRSIEICHAAFVHTHDCRPMVDLCKLHGSIDWYEQEDGRYVKIPVLAPKMTTTGQKVKRPVIFLPLSQSDLFSEPYVSHFKYFKDTLCQDRLVIICVGYGFNDIHILNAFRHALSVHSATLWMIDLSAGSILKDKFPRYHNQVFSIEGNFADVSTLESLQKSMLEVLDLNIPPFPHL